MDENPLEPIQIQLRDGVHELCFTVSSIKWLQERFREILGTQMNIFELLSEKNQTELGIDAVIARVTAALRHEKKEEITEEHVADVIDVRSLNEIAEKIALALGGYFEGLKSAAPRSNGQKVDSPLAESPGSISGPLAGSS
jgi:hypothetical protein